MKIYEVMSEDVAVAAFYVSDDGLDILGSIDYRGYPSEVESYVEDLVEQDGASVLLALNLYTRSPWGNTYIREKVIPVSYISLIKKDMIPVSVVTGTMAMTGQDGAVEFLFRTNREVGAIIRHKGKWNPLVNLSILEDVFFVGVTDDAVEIYDKFDAEDRQADIMNYPLSPDGPSWNTEFQIDYSEEESSLQLLIKENSKSSGDRNIESDTDYNFTPNRDSNELINILEDGIDPGANIELENKIKKMLDGLKNK